jgi:ribonuclease BN (tRNA processing enzyme)
MGLSLTVLGGAAAWPNPGQGCSSYLVREDHRAVLLDCGANTLLELRRHIDYAAIDAVVISHCHADHILDLVPYRYGLVYGAAKPQRRIPVYVPPGGRERLDLLGRAFDGLGEYPVAFWESVFDLIEYDPGEHLDVSGFDIWFASSQHFVDCFAIRVNAGDGKALAYSSDTGSIVPLKPIMRGADIVVIEATLDDYGDQQPSQRGHLTPEDAGRLASDAAAKTLVLTHLWSERPVERVIERAARHFDGAILVAKPGLCVDV